MTSRFDRMKSLLFATFLAFASSGFTGFAQMGGPPKSGVNAALTKLFGSTTAFTAQCDVRLLDQNQKEKMSMPMEFSLLDSKVRAEIDMTQIKGQGMTPELAAQLKQMGMERVVSITRPDKKTRSIVYPAVQAIMSTPLDKEELDVIEKEPAMEKTVLAKETLDGHPCEKRKIVLTDASGRKSEAFIWSATDLKEFPVQIQMTEGADTVILRYTNIRLTKPEASLFDLPAGYTTYDSQPAFMMGVMQKMMGGAGKN
jgi:hypothetical protein